MAVDAAARYDALVTFLQAHDEEEWLEDVWYTYATKHVDATVRETRAVKAERYAHLVSYLKRVEPEAFARCEKEGLV